MTIQYNKLFEPLQLGVAAATIYTMPTTPTGIICPNMQLRLTNTAAAIRSATLYAVPLAGSATATNTFLSAYSLAAGESIEVNVPTLKAGDFIQGLADTATSINVQLISGVLRS